MYIAQIGRVVKWENFLATVNTPSQGVKVSPDITYYYSATIGGIDSPRNIFVDNVTNIIQIVHDVK